MLTFVGVAIEFEGDRRNVLCVDVARLVAVEQLEEDPVRFEVVFAGHRVVWAHVEPSIAVSHQAGFHAARPLVLESHLPVFVALAIKLALLVGVVGIQVQHILNFSALVKEVLLVVLLGLLLGRLLGLCHVL